MTSARGMQALALLNYSAHQHTLVAAAAVVPAVAQVLAQLPQSHSCFSSRTHTLTHSQRHGNAIVVRLLMSTMAQGVVCVRRLALHMLRRPPPALAAHQKGKQATATVAVKEQAAQEEEQEELAQAQAQAAGRLTATGHRHYTLLSCLPGHG